MTKTLPRVERVQGTGGTLPLLHRVDPKRRDHALCGKKLTHLVGPITEAECVVCEDLWRSRR